MSEDDNLSIGIGDIQSAVINPSIEGSLPEMVDMREGWSNSSTQHKLYIDISKLSIDTRAMVETLDWDKLNRETYYKIQDAIKTENEEQIKKLIETWGNLVVWSPGQNQTLRIWHDIIKKQFHMYQTVLDYLERRKNRIDIIILSLSSVITILLAFNVTDNINTTASNLSYAITIAVAIISAIMTLISGYSAIKRFAVRIALFNIYTDRLDKFYGELQTQQILPDNIRSNSTEFLKIKSKIYINLRIQAPRMTNDEFIYATKKYKIFQSMLKRPQKYDRRFNMCSDESEIKK